MCIPNGKAVEKYNELKEKGKKIILCSDMYLPIDTMKKILDKCGINGYDNLFVSSDIGKSKKSGELFDYILKKYEIPSDKLIHIGDNPYIDYCVPRLKGINAFLIS
jgi:HAD superfamily hydrolase (TIGR01549 family)